MLLATRSRCWLASTDTGGLVREVVQASAINDAIIDAGGRRAAVLLAETHSRLNRAMSRPVHSLRSFVEVVDLTTGASVRLAPQDHIGTIAFSPDGDVIVTAGKHGDVEGWEAVTGVRLFRLPDHEGEVVFAEFSNDNRRLMTVTRERILVRDVSRLAAWQGRPVLGLAAALADGTGTVSEEERKDILMEMSPVDVHEALLALLSEEDRLEVGHRRSWLQADLSAPAIEKAACGTGGGRRDPAERRLRKRLWVSPFVRTTASTSPCIRTGYHTRSRTL